MLQTPEMSLESVLTFVGDHSREVGHGAPSSALVVERAHVSGLALCGSRAVGAHGGQIRSGGKVTRSSRACARAEQPNE